MTQQINKSVNKVAILIRQRTEIALKETGHKSTVKDVNVNIMLIKCQILYSHLINSVIVTEVLIKLKIIKNTFLKK